MVESLEERIARIEGILNQMDKRLNHLETEVVELSDKIDRNFRWTIGIMLSILIPMWVTIMLAIILRM
jgi:tetrahydromethanopterin S-methyltransferase subunit G